MPCTRSIHNVYIIDCPTIQNMYREGRVRIRWTCTTSYTEYTTNSRIAFVLNASAEPINYFLFFWNYSMERGYIYIIIYIGKGQRAIIITYDHCCWFPKQNTLILHSLSRAKTTVSGRSTGVWVFCSTELSMRPTRRRGKKKTRTLARDFDKRIVSTGMADRWVEGNHIISIMHAHVHTCCVPRIEDEFPSTVGKETKARRRLGRAIIFFRF